MSVDDIAGEAGCTSGALYSNFRSKEGLLAQVVAEHGAGLFSRIAGLLGLGDGSSAAGGLRAARDETLRERVGRGSGAGGEP